MKVRSVTVFAPHLPRDEAALRPLAQFGGKARAALEAADFTVQTVRLATPPWSQFVEHPSEIVAVARWLDQAAPEMGIDYVSLGPVQSAQEQLDGWLTTTTEMLAATERVFCSAHIADAKTGVHVGTVLRVAEIIAANATLDPNGFGNLRFAALANVGPGSPFFPAAYSPIPSRLPGIALALESADLAVQAFEGAPTLAMAMAALTEAVESVASGLVRVMEPIAEHCQGEFFGLDFSLAPFPDAATSGAGAIESLGASPFGAMGTLAAAALTTQALQQARYPHCGFSGLMLPVLEDSVLAARAGEGTFDLHSLLLYSAVCGTGLDTVPLPGNIPTGALAAILLDVAALAVRLDKPLTARLMPVPGKAAGDPTTFDFPFFANGTVMEALCPRGGALLAAAPLPLQARQSGHRASSGLN